MTENAAILLVPSDGALAAELPPAVVPVRPTAEPELVLFDGDAFEDPFPRVAQLRELHPDAFVLVVSARSTPENVVEAMRAGAHDWIARPLDPRRTEEAIQRARLRRHLQRQRRGMLQTLEAHGRRVELERRELQERMAAMAADLEATHRQLEEAHRELRGRVAQLTMLYRIGHDLSSQRNWDEALDSFLASLCRFLDASGAALLLSSDGGRRLTARSVRGFSRGRVDRAIEMLRPRARAQKGDARLLPLSQVQEAQPRACPEMVEGWRETVLPLCHRGQELGYLLLDKSYDGNTQLDEDFYFLITIQTVLAEEVASAQAFSALRRLQRFQARTLDHLTNGVLTVDGEGRVTSANAKAKELLGEVPTGERLASVLRIEGVDTELGPWLAARVHESTVGCDGWIHRGDAERALPVSIVATPVPGELPEYHQVVCVLEDQRQRHALEAERRRASRQNELLIMAAEWAHDVRTPLTGILHSSELLAEALPPDSKKRRHFQVVRGEVDRIEKLVSHFLDYARPVTPKRVDLDLGALAREAAQLLDGPARRRGRRVRFEGTVGSSWIRGDRDMLKQVVLNLVSNALDATPEDTVVDVILDARPADVDVQGGASAVAVLEVRDRGAGVPAEHIDRLFVPFFTTKAQGTGLGLAISDKIVRAHEGHLRYDRRDATTILRMVLPLKDLPAASGPAAVHSEASEARSSELEARG